MRSGDEADPVRSLVSFSSPELSPAEAEASISSVPVLLAKKDLRFRGGDRPGELTALVESWAPTFPAVLSSSKLMAQTAACKRDSAAGWPGVAVPLGVGEAWVVSGYMRGYRS